MLRAITDVMAGRIALSPDIDHEFAISRLANEPSAIDTLSPREFEILRMLLAEKSVDDIASTLHISVKTAANTRYQIHARLGVGSDIELVRLALRQRIIAAEDIGGEPDPRPLADRRHHVSAKNEAIGSSAQP